MIVCGDGMENKKKAVAAAAAVIEYIAAEEAAAGMASMAPSGVGMPAPGAAAPGPVKLWGMSGRQAQMQMRSLMQMRTFR
jgi:uncharacterized protein (UPF0210 family)